MFRQTIKPALLLFLALTLVTGVIYPLLVTGIAQLQSTALFAPVVIAVCLALMFLVVRALARLGSASRRTAAPWLCGYAIEADCHRYSAHNFYIEIKRHFHWLGGAPRPQSEKPSAKP